MATRVELKQKEDVLFDRKLQTVTAGLPKEYFNLLEKIPREDIMTVIDYMISLKSKGFHCAIGCKKTRVFLSSSSPDDRKKVLIFLCQV